MEELARMLYYNKESLKKISSFCPKVFDAACEGDEIAQNIIKKFGEEAGISANALIRRLGFENEEFECVMAGSVFKGKGTLMMDTVRNTVLQVAPRAHVITPRYEPVVGALMLAFEAVGIQIEGELERRLDSSVPDELKRG